MQGDMLMRPFTALLCIGLWCMQPAVPAAEPQPAEIDRPCIEGSPEFVDVAKKLTALDGQIRTLKPDSDHRPANEALMALMRHQCMALANVDENALHAEAAPALTELWEAGGRQWSESVLKLDNWALLSATGEALVSSTVSVPACDEPGVDYARQLLRIVESGFVEGCPREAPPKEMSTGNPGPLGSKPAERQPVYADVSIMTKAFEIARTACPPRR